MIHDESISDLDGLLARLEPPVLIVSTVVGRGMYSLGEAVRQRCPDPGRVVHIPIESCLPPRAVQEDLERYRWIAAHARWLLYLVYTVPLIYARKHRRERRRPTDLSVLQDKIRSSGARTVLCISHRPAFWVTNARRLAGLEVQCWGLNGEYGRSLGWKYIFWEQMSGYLSPTRRVEHLDFPFPPGLDYRRIELPARREFASLATSPGDPRRTLLVCGYWGQGSLGRIVAELRRELPALSIDAVCGDNLPAYEELHLRFADDPQVRVLGPLETLAPLLAECASVITKPGISTLLEAHAARRKLFLLPGMPIAEDHNRDHALAHFAAEPFSIPSFKRWFHGIA